MKYRALAMVLALGISIPVAAEEKAPQQPSERPHAYTPSLAVVMELIQLSHFKLWLGR